MRSDNRRWECCFIWHTLLCLPHRTPAKFNLISLSADVWIQALLIRDSIVSLPLFLHTKLPLFLSLPPPPPAHCLIQVLLSYILLCDSVKLLSDSESSKDTFFYVTTSWNNALFNKSTLLVIQGGKWDINPAVVNVFSLIFSCTTKMPYSFKLNTW